MQDELTEDYRDMIYADTAAEIDKRRKAFLRPPLGYKWSGSCARLEPLPGTSFMTGSGGVRPFPSWSLWAVYEYGRPRLFY